jgi:ABC-type multidrug transport system ATPase subunit
MIRVTNLTKKFKDFAAVNDVSFEVERGETLALLGPNGSGKTTTLKCMVGLTLPSSGSIAVDKFDVVRNAREAKRLVSFLPQRVGFCDQLTGREVLEFYCRLRQVPSKRVNEILNTPDFHFNGFFNKSVSQFSGGMTQRLGLAVACLPDAPVLILDEPTVSLDPAGAIEFREFLSSLKRQGKTVVFSSHMLPDVEQLADRVGIMVGGRLVALQSINALREQLAANARLRVTLTRMETKSIEAAMSAGATEVKVDGSCLIIVARPDTRLSILRMIEEAGGRIQSFGVEELSLEDVYMKYVNEENLDAQ